MIHTASDHPSAGEFAVSARCPGISYDQQRPYSRHLRKDVSRSGMSNHGRTLGVGKLRLVSVIVENFRRITAARSIPISNLTTLVEPNNDGKSNILRALVMGMTMLVARRDFSQVRQRRYRRAGASPVSRYDWAQDFPLKLQKKDALAGSVITLEFQISPPEVTEFHKVIGSRLNGTLPISLVFSKDKVYVMISKQVRGQKTLNDKALRIADYH